MGSADDQAYCYEIAIIMLQQVKAKQHSILHFLDVKSMFRFLLPQAPQLTTHNIPWIMCRSH